MLAVTDANETTLRKLAGSTRENIQAFMDTYAEYKAVSADLTTFKERWNLDFIQPPKVMCMPASVKSGLAVIKDDLQTARRAQGLAATDVENIVGAEALSEEIIKPAVTYRAGYNYTRWSDNAKRTNVINTKNAANMGPHLNARFPPEAFAERGTSLDFRSAVTIGL